MIWPVQIAAYHQPNPQGSRVHQRLLPCGAASRTSTTAGTRSSRHKHAQLTRARAWAHGWNYPPQPRIYEVHVPGALQEVAQLAGPEDTWEKSVDRPRSNVTQPCS